MRRVLLRLTLAGRAARGHGLGHQPGHGNVCAAIGALPILARGDQCQSPVDLPQCCQVSFDLGIRHLVEGVLLGLVSPVAHLMWRQGAVTGRLNGLTQLGRPGIKKLADVLK